MAIVKENYYDEKNKANKTQFAQAVRRATRSQGGANSSPRTGDNNHDIRIERDGRCGMSIYLAAVALVALGTGIASYQWGREIGESEGYSQGYRDGQSSNF